MHRLYRFVLVVVGGGCTVPHSRAIAYKNQLVWMQLVDPPLRCAWKTRPAAQRPRWNTHSNGVHRLLVCDHALVQGEQTITHVHTYMAIHKWARCTSHLRRKFDRRLGDLGGVCIAMGHTCCWHTNRQSMQTTGHSCADMDNATDAAIYERSM